MTPGMLKPPWHFPIRRGGPPESSGALFKKIGKKNCDSWRKMGTAASNASSTDETPSGPAEAKSGDWLNFMPEMPQDLVGSWGPTRDLNEGSLSPNLMALGQGRDKASNNLQDLAGMPVSEMEGEVLGERSVATALSPGKCAAVLVFAQWCTVVSFIHS